MGFAGCTQLNRVLKLHQLTEHGHSCTAAPVSRLPTDTRTVHGRHGNPQHQESWGEIPGLPGNPGEGACVFFQLLSQRFAVWRHKLLVAEFHFFSCQKIFDKNGSVKQTEGIASIEDLALHDFNTAA